MMNKKPGKVICEKGTLYGPGVSPKTTAGEVYCGYCGLPIPQSMQTCPVCGTEQNEESRMVENPVKREKER